ncbi:uncharacterized protein LOC112598955 [Melanaphis sacchari]|uniref:uncharacterized protein LOC112598955 n=1 Tax=Melanaphis sacchari TaxID=742174 RepID=UPI000DC15977|nr:uncharacterized protein LOC112598955 [Melanaphis sacchari]XP_025201412.1 uncharacterized protein LOC112598955 [Melanaphis sacchari]XP_025201413.1 uncharacterized protein LOC112598955 [Melanaphis sacchari]XP_025201414.1 uncharacterized protein LOC112598955 [Melanaphis sacchari]XP_025201415.1 uncharacterized protein LOC112598955 [Melanaphis sacchari]XP_025201416.1 uncharacterized protein LOC112598955 [Melanaphis sacchari]
MVTVRAPSFMVRRICAFIFLGIMGYSIFQMTRSNSYYDMSDRNIMRKQIELDIIKSSNNEVPDKNLITENNIACPHPILDPFNPVMMSFLTKEEPLACDKEEDWVTVKGNIARITDKALKKYGDIQCKFTDVLRANDFSSSLGVVTTTHTEYNLETSDFFRVYCESENSKFSWESRMAGIRFDEDVINRAGWDQVPKNGLGLNVLILGLDSVSHMLMQRILPKVYSKLKSMNARVLKGYNIVGDGTPQALIPILTGRTELELPDTRKRMGSKASYVDVYPFIWNEFKKYGYVTGFAEDTPHLGIFTYRLKGFDQQPTDHYMRTYYIDSSSMFKYQKPFCYGSLPRHKIMLNYVKDMFRVYEDKPKFMFAFQGELSHDFSNKIALAENDLVEWFDWFEKSGYLNNTMLVFMSDHGQRFTSVRDTQQGKLEERMPIFSFILPKWFDRKYPKLASNLDNNINRLTTPFDIYSTLMSVLHGENFKTDDMNKRSISLFNEIPLERTCKDAYIEPHWCACLKWQPISVDSSLAINAAINFIQFLNRYNAEYTDQCAPVEINRIEWANRMAPNEGLMKFHHAADPDGFVPDMSANTKITDIYLQIKVITQKPANAVFEFTCQYNSNTSQYTIYEKEISRVNSYGNQSWCVAKTQPQLNKYCYCKL